MTLSVSAEAKALSETQTSLKNLERSAKTLNELSDQLAKPVAEIEAAINRLNLGVEANIKITEWGNEDGTQSGLWRLAYGKIAGKWGFIIESITEDMRWGPDADQYESWPFKDAPRDKRLDAVRKIPLLITALVKKSDEVASQIALQLNYAKTLASTLAPVQSESAKK